MPTCIVKGCKNHHRKVSKLDGITYHRLPSDPERREIWSRIIRKYRNDPYFNLTSDSRICSAHFCETDFVYSKTGMRRLLGSAKPQLLEDSESEHSRPSTPDQQSEIEEIEDGEEDFKGLIIFHSPRNITPKNTSFLDKQNSVAKKVKKKQNAKLKKNTSLQDIVKHLKVKNYINDQIASVLNRNVDIAELYRRQARKMKTKRPSCPPGLRKFAMALNFCSPAAYKYVRRKFDCCFPRPRTLTKWYGVVKGEPGFTQESFEMLKLKRDNLSENIECCLKFGDMNIQQHKSCKGQRNAGFVNMGQGLIDEEIKATKAFVMMLVCLSENWKIPVGYFLVDNFTSELIANTVNICVAKCHSVGVNVQAVTFDGCSTNIRAANVLGCNISGICDLKASFPHPVTKAGTVVFLDACHMMELVRNSLQYKKIIFNNQDQRIEWKSLSNFPGTDATVEFINMFNDIFDILNSQSAISQKNKEETLSLIEKAIVYIKGLKIINKVKRTIKKLNRQPRTILITSKKPILVSKIKTGFLGLIVCLESLKILYKNLVETGKLQYISTHRLGDQGHLKLFFNLIRQHGGNNENPTATELKGGYKQYISSISQATCQ